MQVLRVYCLNASMKLTRTILTAPPAFVSSAIQHCLFIMLSVPFAFADPVDIGSRRELFVDRALIDRLGGDARLELHHPEPKEIAITHDAAWEGSGSGYHCVFKDGELYRMYYKAWHLDVKPGAGGKATLNSKSHPLYTCYAESRDGIHWTKPNVGIVEFNGSKENNILFASGDWEGANINAGHIALAKDENPGAAPDARYKGFVLSAKPRGLVAFKSPDGIHWSPMQAEPVLTVGAFDSQNLAFWDGARGEYRAYWRIFTGGVTNDTEWKPTGNRAIRTATSKDFIHWSEPNDLTYEDSPSEQLYTNVVKPYHRAPHLLIGFPTRYVQRVPSESMRALPEREHREMRSSVNNRYGLAITEGLFMASRDGVKFTRWNEAFLRPGIEREGTWNYGHQYIAWHPVETKSALEGAPDELSFYASESYWTGTSSALRRYTLRLDGFVSANGSLKGGELVTKPVRFTGKELHLNFSTSAAGSVKVELQAEDGSIFPGFRLKDCEETFGDSLDRVVNWKSGSDVSGLAGKSVRLRFALQDADVFAYQFR